MANEHSIVPGVGDTAKPQKGVAGASDLFWPASGAIPESYSAGGWTDGNEGYVQQTFLGASIRNFSMNGGFGDSSSTLSVSLVNDEFNKSDETVRGLGDDVYHNGEHDLFSPPPVGTPVFFKFGQNHATMEQAYRATFDKMYRFNTLPARVVDSDTNTTGPISQIPDHGMYLSVEQSTIGTNNVWLDKKQRWNPNYAGRGRDHLVFGGILQSYTQNKGTGGSPVYAAQVTDPREILSNAVLILNNYGGTTFNNKNLFNVFGFLEHDTGDDLTAALDSYYPIKKLLTKNVAVDGGITYFGDDMRYISGPAAAFSQGRLPPAFPITGKGMSRRSDSGIPFYRVDQALTALLEYNGAMPQEYKNMGFGGAIDFRGFKYVVDFSGIPMEKIPRMYFLDFDQIDLLSLAQELCDVISHDLFITLLPVINHPAVDDWLYPWNLAMEAQGTPENMVAGIIRVDAINRSDKPLYGSIKKFIEGLSAKGIEVENQDVGFELSNITTDKFIVGAQQTDMYYFHTNKDRDFLEVRKQNDGVDNRLDYLLGKQWFLSESFQQQVLPFYGFLGKEAVTIPRGFGSYQQILLDATSLNAYGVGNYYVATELELRSALVSYERWQDFLVNYNDVYMESMEDGDVVDVSLLQNTPAPPGAIPHPTISQNYGVCVPRCVFRSDRNYMGDDGLPASPCSPPFGYPLYYKRAEQIGIPYAGVAKISAARTELLTNYGTLSSPEGRDKHIQIDTDAWHHGTDQNRHRLTQQAEWHSQQAIADIGMTVTATGTDAEALQTSALEHTRKAGALRQRARQIDQMQRTSEVRAAVGAGASQAYVNQMGFAEDIINRNCAIMKGIDRLGEKSIENSMKVYNFVKSVAEKHMGKTFLVKIPKRCNLHYDKWLSLIDHGGTTTSALGALGGLNRPEGLSAVGGGATASKTDRISEIAFGPFGFKPEPVSSEVGHYFQESFQQKISTKRFFEFSYNENDKSPDADSQLFTGMHSPSISSYSNGALKVNYNPIEDKYEFNYDPDPAGGFFPFDLYGNLLSPASIALISDQNKLPLATRQYLCPKDLTNFVGDNGRISAYVRYDNSQFLNFHGVSKDSFTQEVVIGGGMAVPDIAEELDNIQKDNFQSFETVASNAALPKTAAFVKCDLNPKFYMSPKCMVVDDKVFGRDVIDIGQYRTPKEIWDSGTCKWVNSYGYYEAHYVPDPATGGYDGTNVPQEDFQRVYNSFLNGDIIRTNTAELDTDNVYAIITLPGRIEPTIDSRMQDGPYQLFQGHLIKHYLTMDTVKNVQGFEKPTMRGKPISMLPAGCNVPAAVISNALGAYNEAMRHLSIASPEKQMHFQMPSPVYPSVVALPLVSRDRCYGPWVSSAVDGQAFRYAGIGGKIEFEKDENLAPWNYTGYQLLNEAGKLKAQFSNALLLFSERGGFVYAGLPEGNSLAEPLASGGPLVTSITCDIGKDGVKTTYKMDLYTSRFGKLQRQKEDLISKVVRERQKIRDMTNALARKGVGKAQTATSFSPILSLANPLLAGAEATSAIVTKLQSKSTTHDMLLSTVEPYERMGHDDQQAANSYSEVAESVNTMTHSEFTDALSLAPDAWAREDMLKRTAGGHLNERYRGKVSAPADKYFPHEHYQHELAKKQTFIEVPKVEKTTGSFGGTGSVAAWSGSTAGDTVDTPPNAGDANPGAGGTEPGMPMPGGGGTGLGADAPGGGDGDGGLDGDGGTPGGNGDGAGDGAGGDPGY